MIRPSAVAVVGVMVWTSAVGAQTQAEVPGERAGPVRAGSPFVADQDAPSPRPSGPSPGGAFLRSVLVPGWGQAASGSYLRAGFYALAEAGTGWMTYKTIAKLEGAKDQRRIVRRLKTQEIRRSGVTDPDSIFALLDADEEVERAEGLVSSRNEQLEDWVALGVFLVLLGGADAFVSAHLADFPEPLAVETGPGPEEGQLEIRAVVPFGGPGGWSR